MSCSENSVRDKQSVGQVFPVVTDGCQSISAGVLSPCLLQIPVCHAVGQFKVDVWIQRHFNKSY